jgi:UDP-N-acetylmuramoyl-tripeptide--D-alanyl-D-alanine ligase
VIEVSIAELAELLGADLLSPGVLAGRGSAAATPITGLAVDSRLVEPGTLFVALPGERVDGHAFVGQAFAAGAAAALIARPVSDSTGTCLLTDDPLLALGRIARDQVDRGVAGGLRVAAVTGSQGKTSTKDLLAQVLETVGPTVAPYGNFNNEVGLPLTVARIGPDTRYLVAEMGARGVGHIAYLCRIAPPEIGIVLNVGSAHLGEFGSVEAIATAKGELVEALPPSGVAVLNADDPRAWAMQDRTVARVVGFSARGRPAGEDALWADAIHPDAEGCCRFRLHSASETDPDVDVQLRVAGRHQVANALAVAAAARALDVPLDRIAAALGEARPRSRWRMEMRRRAGGGLVINDAYNANPESMRAALDTLVDLGSSAGGVATWAVLGDMLELGSRAATEHRQLGRYAAERGVSRLVVLGAFAAEIAAGAREASAGERPRVEVVADRAAAVAAVLAELGPDDVVLVKASRGLALDTVAEAIGGADPRPPATLPPSPNDDSSGDRA